MQAVATVPFPIPDHLIWRSESFVNFFDANGPRVQPTSQHLVGVSAPPGVGGWSHVIGGSISPPWRRRRRRRRLPSSSQSVTRSRGSHALGTESRGSPSLPLLGCSSSMCSLLAPTFPCSWSSPTVCFRSSTFRRCVGVNPRGRNLSPLPHWLPPVARIERARGTRVWSELSWPRMHQRPYLSGKSAQRLDKRLSRSSPAVAELPSPV